MDYRTHFYLFLFFIVVMNNSWVNAGKELTDYERRSILHGKVPRNRSLGPIRELDNNVQFHSTEAITTDFLPHEAPLIDSHFDYLEQVIVMGSKNDSTVKVPYLGFIQGVDPETHRYKVMVEMGGGKRKEYSISSEYIKKFSKEPIRTSFSTHPALLDFEIDRDLKTLAEKLMHTRIMRSMKNKTKERRIIHYGTINELSFKNDELYAHVAFDSTHKIVELPLSSLIFLDQV